MDYPEEKRGNYSRPDDGMGYLIPNEFAGQRLDKVLAHLCQEHSRTRLQTWLREGLVLINSVVCREGTQKVWGGERIFLYFPQDFSEATVDAAEKIPLNILFQDAEIIVINKPAGLVVHPGNGNRQGTVLNALLHHFPENREIPRAGIVHRLDKDTTGLMVVARTLEAQTHLVRQLQARTVKRQYVALVIGELNRPGSVDAAVGRHPIQRTKMAVVTAQQGGKPALTHYRIMKNFAHSTLIECTLETGRTHQIRVHMAHLGYPLVGDPVYGKKKPSSSLPDFPRQALHAFALGLQHPSDNRPMHWEVPLPIDMQELLAKLL